MRSLFRIFYRLLFILGGGLIALGTCLQDYLPHYLGTSKRLLPDDILAAVLEDNRRSSSVRRLLPRRKRHPLVLVLLCMDPRLDAHVVLGDTRDYYDVLRVPGSVLSDEIIESIELAVREHGVNVVLLTTHSDCAMERVAASSEASEFPALSRGVQNRRAQMEKLIARPAIASRLSAGELVVVSKTIETGSGRLRDLSR